MEKYYKYKHIFSGAQTIEDIQYLREKCPKEDYPLIDSLIRTIKIKHKLSFIKMNEILLELKKLKYLEECQKYLENFPEYKEDKLQNSVITKILTSKKSNITYIDLPMLDKNCPHCGTINSAPLGTTYIVCGVDSRGITSINNLNGVNYCFGDWCFECGKKLCKSWYENELYNSANRKHDSTCCQLHAIKNGFKYPQDYCNCVSLNLQ